ncbi:MAG: DUF4333 domain-containing protein [Solirubrobacterales bacterium]|jgi:hypothetical protein|nr:DUF4333 domain-containing protein [Solirubrobacterales bacterium]
MFSSKRYLLVLAVLIGSAFALSACEGEVSIGDKTISASELETQSSESLTQEFGQKPASIDCPEDLEAEVGATEVCSLEDQGGGTYDMTIKVTSVDDDGNAQFNIQVGDLKTVNP